ncbi:uncharacterized protein [Medicago truncatula]|uniref:uncharacterized protein n=1 Tax=Medicago truncatula TaxID=3880 RepID=UPI0000D60451|nr:uncharacterized protein LOC112416671 [Medicago truncatula]
MVVFGGEGDGEMWGWRRPLRAWEEELLEECRLLINGVILQHNISDRWQWDSDYGGGYSVGGAYHHLTTQAEPPDVPLGDLIWHKQVPLKVSIFAWRLLRDRLPTKNHLFRRGIINSEACMCVTGCGMEETTSHLFIHCTTFGSLWHLIRSLIGMSGADPFNINDHFIQFIHSTGHSKARQSFLQLIWLLCVWVVWNERNNRLFNNIQTTVDNLADKVRFHSLWWLQANNANFMYGTQRWWSDPLFCLGLDRPLF